MKVLFLTPYPREGASNRYRVLQYLPYLDRAGIRYSVRSFLTTEFYQILYKPRNYGRKLWYFTIATLRRITDILSARNYDVVFVHRECYPIGPPIFERLLHWMGVPLIYDFDDAIYLPTARGRLKNFLKNPQKVNTIIKLSDQVIVCNEYLKRYAEKLNSHVTIVPTPLDTEHFVPRRRHKNRKSLVIGWVGSHTTTKYLDALIPVLQQLRQDHDFELLLVGADRDITIPGVRVINRKWTLVREVVDFQDIDIGIYPLVDDAWTIGKTGFKTIQYMSVGIPCVVSKVGANKTTIRDGVNGFLATTPEEWVRKLSHLLSDHALRERMGRTGRKTVLERFSTDVNAQVLLRILQQTGKPRILHLISDLDIGGTEKMLAEVTMRLQHRYAFHICCIALPGPVAAEIQRNTDARIYALGVHSRFNLTLFPRFAFLVWRVRPAILQTYLFHDNFIGRVVGRIMRVPFIIAGQRAINPDEPLFRRLLERLFWHWSDCIVSNSMAGKRTLTSREHIPASRITVIPNGKELPDADAGNPTTIRRRLRIPSSALVITVVAKLRHQKGHAYLIEAAPHILAAYPKMLFLFVGDGPLRAELTAMVARRKLSQHIRFLGDRTDVQDILRITDVFCMPSLWEGLPGAIMEAMAMRVPVVATRVSGTPELMVDGKTGFLVPPRDASALAVRILQLLDDGALRSRFGVAGRERVEQYFTIQQMVRAYEHVYDAGLRKLPREDR